MMLARSITLLLCLCALALRVGGMHVHVAVDHDDAQHQAHFAAFDLHQAAHLNHVHDHDEAQSEIVGDPHQHIEVSLDSQALSKKPGADPGIDALLLLATLFCLLLAPRKLMLPPTQLIATPLRRIAHFRPPLRGPPLHA